MPSTDTHSQQLHLRQSDFQSAATQGLISTQQADALWQHWAQTTTPTQALAFDSGPRFSFTNTLYYFGGMVAIGAMTLFMTLGWQEFGDWGLALIAAAYLVSCLKVADYLKARQLTTPAGILATLAVCMVPIFIWGVQSGMGYWPPGRADNIRDYHSLIDWRWLTLEFATLAAGVVMLWRYRLPFMVMPIAVTLWYMSMDAANALMMDHGFDFAFMRDVSLVFGIATCAVALWVTLRTVRSQEAVWRQDFAFWLHIYGVLMFWAGLSLRDSGSEWGKLAYAFINVALVFFGAAIGRRVYTVFGALGVTAYLGYLSHRVFQNSLLFPFALTLLGLGVVWAGIWWQRHEAAINARLTHWLPEGLRPR